MTWDCFECTFTNDDKASNCEICDAFEPSFCKRWKDATVLVIGAAYDECDNTFWSIIDPNYIGIGYGKHCFNSIPVWQTNWDTDGFWDQKVPDKKDGFKRVFIDRCVWNTFVSNIDTHKSRFSKIIKFIVSQLSENGVLHIAHDNWKIAEHAYMYSKFSDLVDTKYKRYLGHYIILDSSGVEVLMSNGNLMIMENTIVTHPPTTPNMQGRTKWKGFIKYKKYCL